MGNYNAKEIQELKESVQSLSEKVNQSETNRKNAEAQLEHAEEQRQQAEQRVEEQRLQTEAKLKQAEAQRQQVERQAEVQRQQAEAQLKQAEAQRRQAEAQLKQLEVQRAEAQRSEVEAAEVANIMRSIKQRLHSYHVNVAVTGLQASGKTSFICSAIQAFQTGIPFPTLGAPGSRTTRHIVPFSLAEHFNLIDLAGVNSGDGLTDYMRAVQNGASEQNLVVDEELIPASQLKLTAPTQGVKFQWIIVLDGLKLFDRDPNGNAGNYVASDKVYGPYLKCIYQYLESQHDVLTVVLSKKDKLKEKKVSYDQAFDAVAEMLKGFAKDRFFWIDLHDPKNLECVRTTAEIFNCIVGRKVVQ